MSENESQTVSPIFSRDFVLEDAADQYYASENRFYIYNHRHLVTDRHDAVAYLALVRGATNNLAGQIFLKFVSQNSIFSMDELAGEYMGAIPMADDDPRKPLAVRTAAYITEVVWSEAASMVEETRSAINAALVADLADFPEIPREFEGKPFVGVELLYAARGGQYNALAGMSFLYGDNLSENVTGYVAVMLDVADQVVAEQMRGFLQRLIAHRNNWIENVYVPDSLTRMMDSLLDALGVEDAKALYVANKVHQVDLPATAANDDSITA